MEEKINDNENLKTPSNDDTPSSAQENPAFNANLPRNKQRNQPSKSSSSKKKSAPVSKKKEARNWNDIDNNITNQDIDKFDEYFDLIK